MAKRKLDKSAADFLREDQSLPSLSEAAKNCQGCDLYKYATQTVFGEGSSDAKIVLVGEQPGNVEDKTGRVFSGPAGKMLDKALELAGIDRDEVYLTNAVKHFKFEDRGKARLHKKPRTIEVNACLPWLEKELEEIVPEAIVCLGATAARAVFGREMKVMSERGKLIPTEDIPAIAEKASYVMITIHPSSILRQRDHESRENQLSLLVKDLKLVANSLKKSKRRKAS